MSRYLFTSESVTEGHPDKVCDAISDAVLDAALTGDPRSRVACETLCKTGFVVVAGEITTKAWIDFGRLAREVIKDIGYTDSAMGFDSETCGVLTAIEPQSPDISQGVTEGEGLFKEQGAGDQGLMFGYACDETEQLMPAPIMYAHALTKRLAEIRKSKKVDFLRPDGKSQVTVEYEGGDVKRIDAVVLSTQHSPDVKYKTLKDAIMELVIKKTLPAKLLDKDTKYYVNPTGRFVIGGPFGDAGLTGRKIIVDTYGGMGRHGGGAFSGKDPSKVDRSACYYARWVAKNIVAAGLARRCEVQVAYAIGVAQPMGVYVHTFGTGKVDDEKLADYVAKNFDMRPRAIIETLDLLKPVYRATSSYGHFGRSEFRWEQPDRAEELAEALRKGGTSKRAAASNGATNGAAGARRGAGKAAAAKAKPVAAAKQPTAAAKQPTAAAKQLVAAVKQPVATAKQLVAAVKQPIGASKAAAPSKPAAPAKAEKKKRARREARA